MRIIEPRFSAAAKGDHAVSQLASLAIEREKTRRLLIAAACALFIVASLVMVFSPSGRESASYILGAVLIVMALGAIGASHFKFSVPGIEVEAHDGRPDDGLPRGPGADNVHRMPRE